MKQKIDKQLLSELSKHSRKISKKRMFQSMGYERCGELPWVASKLESLYSKNINYLDIGTGTSVLPTYIMKKTNWDITCVDKFSWVQSQHKFAKKVLNNSKLKNRLHVIEDDIINTNLPLESFDVITNISVVEHFEGNNDSVMMEKTAKLLKPGGLYILTTLVNDKFFKEFFVDKNVYGEKYKSDPVFFQRHYDLETISNRLIKPSRLLEKERVYLGDYDFQFCERLLDIPWPFKPIKIFYQWANPFFARRFLSYRNYPINRPEMTMYTSSCVCMVLEKPI